MIFKPKTTEPTLLDLAINETFDRMKLHDQESKEYAAIVDQLGKLLKLKEETEKPKRIDPNVALQVGGSIAGILLILHYERVNVVATKALGFVLKAK